jgi:hypothetical protein
VGRTADGKTFVAAAVEGRDVAVYQLDAIAIQPVLRGKLSGATVRLKSSKSSGQLSIAGDTAVLRQTTAAGGTRTTRLVRAGSGDGLLRAVPTSSAAEASGIVDDFTLRLAVTASTSSGSAAPTLRSVVATARLVELPDETLRRLQRLREQEQAERDMLCRQLKVELGVLETKRLAEKQAAVAAKMLSLSATVVSGFQSAAVKDGASPALVSARAAEIRGLIATFERALKRTVAHDWDAMIAEIKARAETLGCEL